MSAKANQNMNKTMAPSTVTMEAPVGELVLLASKPSFDEDD